MLNKGLHGLLKLFVCNLPNRSLPFPLFTYIFGVSNANLEKENKHKNQSISHSL